MKKILTLGLLLFSATCFATTPANLYECTGNGVKVSYTKTSLAGPPRISFTIGGQTFSGNGAGLTDEPTVMGHLLTIIKAAVPDLQTDFLTLLAPDVNLSGFGASTQFSTRVFATRSRTSIGGPQLVLGPIQTNTSVAVICKATAAVF
jgi:hypothetical protein